MMLDGKVLFMTATITCQLLENTSNMGEENNEIM
jgi:CRISPR/Cas system-associated endonuclease/helicase Cas3